MAKRDREEPNGAIANGDHPSPAKKVRTAEEKAERRARKEAKAARKAEKEARKASKKTRSTGVEDDVSSESPHASAVESSAPPSKGASSATTPEPVVKSKSGKIKNSTGYAEHASLSKLAQSDIETYLSEKQISINEPRSTTSLRPITKFSYLDLDEQLAKPFAGFASPTPIQAASWPYLLSGRDMIGVAETGSGKTLAFGLPCVRHILAQKKRKGAGAVVVSPTRELAIQIQEQLVKLAEPVGLHCACIYGGVPKDDQRVAMKKANIIVATPGRLNDLLGELPDALSGAKYVVLDEADRMLDKGFEEDIRKIVGATAPSTERQTLMFTATWPPSVRDLAATFMREPVRINIGDNNDGELRANTRISQTVEVVDPRGKEQRLLQLLKEHTAGKKKDDRILIFALYKKEATRVENFIRAKGFRVAGIHGDLSQVQRLKSLENFKKGDVPLLVATDVAARGLDIPAVKLVINVTFPLTAEDYVHRIGRTGRAGKEGKAITLFTEQDKALSGA